MIHSYENVLDVSNSNTKEFLLLICILHTCLDFFAMSCPFLHGPALSYCPALHYPVLSCTALSCCALPCRILSRPVLSYPALSNPVSPCLVLSYSALSYSIPPGPILAQSCPAFPCPVVLCPVYSIPPCPIISYLAQSCPALLSRALPVLSFVPFHIPSLPVLSVLSCPALPCPTIGTRIQYILCKWLFICKNKHNYGNRRNTVEWYIYDYIFKIHIYRKTYKYRILKKKCITIIQTAEYPTVQIMPKNTLTVCHSHPATRNSSKCPLHIFLYIFI